MDNALLFKIGCVGLTMLVFVLLFAAQTLKNERTRYSNQLYRLNKTYLSKQGGTSTYNGTMLNYNLQSYDGGKIWYAIEYGEDWEVKILGEAEKVYPGLMKHLEAWDKLTSYVQKNGPIGSTPITDELKDIMKDAKLELVTK